MLYFFSPVCPTERRPRVKNTERELGKTEKADLWCFFSEYETLRMPTSISSIRKIDEESDMGDTFTQELVKQRRKFEYAITTDLTICGIYIWNNNDILKFLFYRDILCWWALCACLDTTRNSKQIQLLWHALNSSTVTSWFEIQLAYLSRKYMLINSRFLWKNQIAQFKLFKWISYASCYLRIRNFFLILMKVGRNTLEIQ